MLDAGKPWGEARNRIVHAGSGGKRAFYSLFCFNVPARFPVPGENATAARAEEDASSEEDLGDGSKCQFFKVHLSHVAPWGF